MADLTRTQGSHILTDKEFTKLFLALSRDNFFVFRANMAEAIGKIVGKKKPDGGEQGHQGDENDFGMTIEDFQEHYYEEL